MARYSMAFELTDTLLYYFELPEGHLLEVMGYILHDRLAGEDCYCCAASHHSLGPGHQPTSASKRGYPTREEALQALDDYLMRFDPQSAVENWLIIGEPSNMKKK